MVDMRRRIILLGTAMLILSSCSRGSADPLSGKETSSAPAAASTAPTGVPHALPAATAEASLTTAQKLEDFDYMWRLIEENYPFLEVNKRLNGKDFLAEKEEFRSKIAATATDSDFLKRMNYVMARLNNGHTGMVGKDEYKYKLMVYGQGDPSMLPWFQVLQQPQVLARYNQKPVAALQQDQESAAAVPVTGGGSGSSGVRSGNVKTDILEPGRTAYLGIRSFGGEYMEMDAPVIRDFLAEVKDYKSLIIDIRKNGGGNSLYWRNYIVPLLLNKSVNYNTYSLIRGGEYSEPFLKARNFQNIRPIAEIEEEKLPNVPPEAADLFKSYIKHTDIVEPYESVGFKGHIYLLVDSFVYSSAEGFASFAKSSHFATLIGGKTAGDGLGIDPLLAALPNSGYVFSFSFLMGLTSDGSCNEEVKTVPDFEVDPDTSRPLLDQPAMQKALELAGEQ